VNICEGIPTELLDQLGWFGMARRSRVLQDEVDAALLAFRESEERSQRLLSALDNLMRSVDAVSATFRVPICATDMGAARAASAAVHAYVDGLAAEVSS
jgi:hypothetical protein